jgi:hypothetical protein
MDNNLLGNAVMAYVSQSFGVDQLSQDYRVECSTGTKYVLIWNRAEAEPTEEQLEAALNIFNWDNVRIQRDSLLAATDFYALSDVTMSDDMETYRQALRDLPESVENSEDVVWPEKP